MFFVHCFVDLRKQYWQRNCICKHSSTTRPSHLHARWSWNGEQRTDSFRFPWLLTDLCSEWKKREITVELHPGWGSILSSSEFDVLYTTDSLSHSFPGMCAFRSYTPQKWHQCRIIHVITNMTADFFLPGDRCRRPLLNCLKICLYLTLSLNSILHYTEFQQIYM